MAFIRASVLGLVLALGSLPVAGSPNLEGQTKSVTTEYEDGDKISILCSRNSCGLTVHVNGKTFNYTQADFGDIHLSPRFARLFAYPRTNPGYFIVEVSAWCPDAEEMADHYDECTAGAGVEEGQPLRLTLDHHPS